MALEDKVREARKRHNCYGTGEDVSRLQSYSGIIEDPFVLYKIIMKHYVEEIRKCNSLPKTNHYR